MQATTIQKTPSAQLSSSIVCLRCWPQQPPQIHLPPSVLHYPHQTRKNLVGTDCLFGSNRSQKRLKNGGSERAPVLPHARPPSHTRASKNNICLIAQEHLTWHNVHPIILAESEGSALKMIVKSVSHQISGFKSAFHLPMIVRVPASNYNTPIKNI